MNRRVVDIDNQKNVRVFKFPSGENHIELDDFDTHAVFTDVYVSLNSSDKFFVLAQVIQRLRNIEREHFIQHKIFVHIRYMGYQQADRDFNDGGAFDLKIASDFLNALSVDSYIITDPHSMVSVGMINNCSEYIPTIAVQDAVKDIKGEVSLLSPDAGAYKKVFKIGEDLGINVISGSKFRNRDNSIVSVLPDLSNEDSILIVDDLCLGGRTFINISEEAKKKNPNVKVYLYITHGIFSNGLKEMSKHFDKIYCCPTYQNKEWYSSEGEFGMKNEKYLHKLTVL